MTLLQSILLGIIQGLTEFLPISSSAHLVIFPYLLKWQIPSNEAFVFDVLVQVASTIAVILFFWKDLVSIFQAFLSNIVNKRPLRDPNSSLGWYLIIATIPAGVLGVALKGFVERAFATPVTAAVFLLFTALLLLIAERVGKQSRAIDTLSWKDSLWIGMAQALAIFPGISRSGATIAGGMTFSDSIRHAPVNPHYVSRWFTSELRLTPNPKSLQSIGYLLPWVPGLVNYQLPFHPLAITLCGSPSTVCFQHILCSFCFAYSRDTVSCEVTL